MANPLIEEIKEVHHLARWLGETAEAPSSLVWRFFFGGWEIADAAAASARVRATGNRRTAHATWQRQAAPDGLFTIDVFENASREAAVETLAEVLASFEHSAFERVDSLGVGELCFVQAGANAVIFLRGNIVTRALRADYGPVALDEAARDLDGLFTGARALPAVAGPAVVAEEAALFVPRAQADGVTIELLESPALLATIEQVWYRFRTNAGTLAIENRRPVVRLRRADVPRVTAEAITSGGVSRQAIDLGAAGR